VVTVVLAEAVELWCCGLQAVGGCKAVELQAAGLPELQAAGCGLSELQATGCGLWAELKILELQAAGACFLARAG
jgi:hypothetical protein